eukprot:m.130558 g.130558  ORF g.130558 m.130558 type:complete len:99 (-) comp13905_c0_seq1:665-961(-)
MLILFQTSSVTRCLKCTRVKTIKFPSKKSRLSKHCRFCDAVSHVQQQLDLELVLEWVLGEVVAGHDATLILDDPTHHQLLMLFSEHGVALMAPRSQKH